MKTKILKSFDFAAESYDEYAVVQRSAAQDLFLAIQKSNINNVNYILDAGCGTGFMTRSLFSLFPCSSYILLDFSQEMVRVCQKKFSNNPLIHYICEDLNTMTEYPKVDLIVANLSMQWLQSIKDTLKNMSLSTRYLAFSIPVEGTFQSWIDTYKKFNLTPKTLPFLKEEDLLSFIKDLGIQVSYWEIKDKFFFYKNPLDFLKSLKQTGTQESFVSTTPLPLRSMLGCWSKGIDIHYRILNVILKISSIKKKITK